MESWFYFQNVKWRHRCKQTSLSTVVWVQQCPKNEDVEKENLNMEKFLKTSLNLRNVQATNQFGGGCINQGQTFIVDDNNKIYVKQNSNIVSIFFSLNCRTRNSLVMMFEIIIFLKVEVAWKGNKSPTFFSLNRRTRNFQVKFLKSWCHLKRPKISHIFFFKS